MDGLPSRRIVIPSLDALKKRQLQTASVLGLEDNAGRMLDALFAEMLHVLASAT
jgi:hypothetical protein